MQLDYLLFDFTDEETGAGSFDAMASVLPDRLPALLREVEAVLQWAHRRFGPPAASADSAGWDFDLQGTGEAGEPLQVAYDAVRGRVAVESPASGRSTLSLTLGGPATFCEAFRHAFPEPE